MELPTEDKAICPLSVGTSLIDLAGPMGCLGDKDQFVFMDRIEPDHPIVDLQEKIMLEDLFTILRDDRLLRHQRAANTA